MIRDRRGPQAVVERVLAERALRPVEADEHRVEIEVVPGAVVQRGGSCRLGHS